jgi:hypothetical protein
MNITATSSAETAGLLSKFDTQEMRTCFDAAMHNDPYFSREILFKTLRSDFEALGNIMSGSDEHYKLLRKIRSLSDLEKTYFANICIGMWQGNNQEIKKITEAVNTNCIDKDVMKLTGFPLEYENVSFLAKDDTIFEKKVKLLPEVSYELQAELDYGADPSSISFEIYRTTRGEKICNQGICNSNIDIFYDAKICLNDHEINKFFKQSYLLVDDRLQKELFTIAGIPFLANVA